MCVTGTCGANGAEISFFIFSTAPLNYPVQNLQLNRQSGGRRVEMEADTQTRSREIKGMITKH
jgi:hypothetical protein